jgi:hypothetical protein
MSIVKACGLSYCHVQVAYLLVYIALLFEVLNDVYTLDGDLYLYGYASVGDVTKN